MPVTRRSIPWMQAVLSTLLLAVLGAGIAHATALDDYVARPDTTWSWKERRSGELDGVRWAELRLVSQTWRDIMWQHQLYVLYPSNAPHDVRQALLYVDGGRWREEYDDPVDSELPSNARFFADLSRRLGTPLAVLRQVPFQPLFGLREDDLIAHTFEQYLKTGEADWPLLLPMVKSVVRAMDAVQASAAAKWKLSIEEFTVTGASKRGWTTWLSAAVDKRVTAIAPIVFDILNMQAQIEHQRAVWGSLSEQIGDYTRRGLDTRLASDAGRGLREIVDPYSYRERLVLPKLIILATNDPYWPVDALSLYWEGLPEPKDVLYVPNADHHVNQRDRIVGGLVALHAHASGRVRMPIIDWAFDEQSGVLSVQSDRQPTDVDVWVATAKSRDFRKARWRAHPARKDGDRYVFEVRAPARRYEAAFAELTFSEPVRYRLSTGVQVVAGAKTGS